MGDLPDYTKQVVIRYEGGFIGLEELAARLGFIGPWDLRGNIVLMEDFESEETEWADSSLGESSATRSSRHKWSGDWSLKLDKEAVWGNNAETFRSFHFPGLIKYGLFGRLAFDDNLRWAYLGLNLYSGSQSFYPSVSYRKDDTGLYISVVGGPYEGGAEMPSPLILYGESLLPDYWHKVAELNLLQTSFAWFPFLITFDLETGYYDKLYVAGQEYDISGHRIYAFDDTTPPRCDLWCGIYEDGTPPSGYTVYVDDIIIAKNVP